MQPQLREIHGVRFSSVFHSITSGNDRAFASLPQTLPETPIYYAYPYSAYEHGWNKKAKLTFFLRMLP